MGTLIHTQWLIKGTVGNHHRLHCSQAILGTTIINRHSELHRALLETLTRNSKNTRSLVKEMKCQVMGSSTVVGVRIFRRRFIESVRVHAGAILLLKIEVTVDVATVDIRRLLCVRTAYTRKWKIAGGGCGKRSALRLYLLYAKDRALAHCKYGSDFFRPNNHHALQGKAGTAFTKDGARARICLSVIRKTRWDAPTTVGENRSFLLCSGPELPMDMQRDFERQLETLARPMLCDYNCPRETGAFGTHIEIHTNCEGEDPCFVYTGFGDRETSWRSSTAKELPLAGGDWVLVEASLHLHDDPHRVPRKVP
ncbi:hypothetical protein R3P38DRAFT_2799102 [Favolaschia claudopus]|uniref:Uncharacterized protein n=1 Tax=Favolaschia claudopus TaxID=2862362 RepID=A0AAW0A284_9AGAR